MIMRWAHLEHSEHCHGWWGKTRCFIIAAWPFLASAVVVAVLVMSTVVSIGAIQDRDRLTRVISTANRTAADARLAARYAATTAVDAKNASAGNRALLEQFRPCFPGDPTETPGCQRQARTDAIIANAVGQISSSLAKGLALHDLNSHREIEELRARIAAGTAPISGRQPIPIPSVPSATPPTAPPPPSIVPAPSVVLPPITLPCVLKNQRKCP